MASAVRRSEEETGFAIRDLRLAEQQPLGKNNKSPQKSSFSRRRRLLRCRSAARSVNQRSEQSCSNNNNNSKVSCA